MNHYKKINKKHLGCAKNLGITLFWGLCSNCKIPCFLPDFYPRLPAHPKGAARLTPFHHSFPSWLLTSALNCTKNNVQLCSGQHSGAPGGAPTHFPSKLSIILLHESLPSGKSISPTPHNYKVWPCFPSGLYLQIWAQNLLTVQWGSGLFRRVLWLGWTQQCLQCSNLFLKMVPMVTGP